MKLIKKGIGKKEPALLPLFAAGVFLGIACMICFQHRFLTGTGFFDADTLYNMKSRVIDSQALFWTLCEKRVLLVAGLFLLSATYLGPIAVTVISLWYGFSLGILTSASVLRYSLRGLLLILAGIFPQYLLYVPAICLTLYLCRKRRLPGTRLVLQCFLLSIVVVIGCFLESYVNPYIVSKMLKIF